MEYDSIVCLASQNTFGGQKITWKSQAITHDEWYMNTRKPIENRFKLVQIVVFLFSFNRIWHKRDLGNEILQISNKR